MSQMGIAPGGCFPRRRTEVEAAPARELSLKKCLSHKGEELVKEGTYESATPSSVLSEYYRENASEGSGQYDVKSLRAATSLVPLKASDVKWFDAQMEGSDKEFHDIVLGLIVSDAMSAIGTDPSLAVALSVARK